MLVKLMGIGDILSAVWIGLLHFGMISWQSTTWVIAFLGFKAITLPLFLMPGLMFRDFNFKPTIIVFCLFLIDIG